MRKGLLIWIICLGQAPAATPEEWSEMKYLPRDARPLVERAETCDRLYKLSLKIQQRLLFHYTAQSAEVPPEVAFVLGRNLFLDHKTAKAEKWLQRAEKSKGVPMKLAEAWLAAIELQNGNQAAAMLRWQSLAKVPNAAVVAEVLYARTESGSLSTFEEMGRSADPALAAALFAAKTSHGGPLLPDQSLPGAIANRPLLTVPLGKIQFTDKTLDYDLKLYDPLVLRWAARHAWKKALKEAGQSAFALHVRAFRRIGLENKALGLKLPKDDQSPVLRAERAAALWMSGRRKEGEQQLFELSRQSGPREVLFLSGLASELDWRLQTWLEKVQACLRALSEDEQYHRLSAARFDNAIRPFLWRLAELRWRLALANTGHTAPYREAMDAALQTLDLAYKRTERHQLSKFLPRQLALAANIYLAADRLDELLYYPLDESMLPAAYPDCRFLRQQASRLQAALKLGSPQLASRTVEPVRHRTRQELLFGKEAAGPGEMEELGEESEGAPGNPRSPVPLLIAAVGLFLILLSAVMILKKRPGFQSRGKDAS